MVIYKGFSRDAIQALHNSDFLNCKSEVRPVDSLKSELPEEEKERIYADLLDYCCLDTLAEVRLLEELYRSGG